MWCSFPSGVAFVELLGISTWRLRPFIATVPARKTLLDSITPNPVPASMSLAALIGSISRCLHVEIAEATVEGDESEVEEDAKSPAMPPEKLEPDSLSHA